MCSFGSSTIKLQQKTLSGTKKLPAFDKVPEEGSRRAPKVPRILESQRQGGQNQTETSIKERKQEQAQSQKQLDESQVRKIQALKLSLENQVKNFKAGQLKEYKAAWEDITYDKEVLETVSGLPIMIGTALRDPVNYPVNRKDQELISREVKKLQEKGVITQCNHEQGEFISPIFLTPKSDGGYRMILNLKRLNETIDKKKFKMQTLSSILCLIKPNMFMSKLDIKDAYYSIPVKVEHQKYLKFEHRNKLYKYTVLPNGYTEGPRKFTKAMKPPLAKLRKEGVSLALTI